MRKLILIVAILATAGVFSLSLLNTSRAQERRFPPSPSSAQDAEMAATVRLLTNSSSDGLVEEKMSDGSYRMDLQGRFQAVPLARFDRDGQALVGCSSIADRFVRWLFAC